MPYKNYIITFIDILGTSQRFRDLSLEDLLYQYNLFYKLKEENYWSRIVKQKAKVDLYNYFLFSDLIVRTIDVEKAKDNIGWTYFFALELAQIAEYQFLLLKESQTLMRGCLSYGELYLDAVRNIIFGNGLVDCYKSEATIANYPRIMVDECLLDMTKKINTDTGLIDELMKFQILDTFNFIKQDYDGIYFLDYLSFYIFLGNSADRYADAFLALDIHKKVIETLLSSDIYKVDLKARQKLYWLINYHNSVVNQQSSFANNTLFTDYGDDRLKQFIITTANKSIAESGAGN